MTVVSARVMHLAERPVARFDLGAWRSVAVAVRLVEAVLTTSATGHHVVWGVSRNTRRDVDLGPGEAIGYHLVDDAESWVHALRDLPAPSSPHVLGGDFTEPGHPIGVDWRTLGL
ncbi:hypothetical protein IF650_08070 [Cellulosimicrobium terreum]|nr:hypothetical protein [Cellulosimicrobium terreum]